MIKLTDILFEGKLSKSKIKKMRKDFEKTGKLPPHLQKVADLMKKDTKIKDVVVPGLEWMAEEKLTERRAQQARNWLDAVKLSRKGAGRKLQYKDKNGNPIYGNTQFYFQKVLHQVYPDDERTAYVAYNKKRNKVRSLNNFFTSDWKKIQIATG